MHFRNLLLPILIFLSLYGCMQCTPTWAAGTSGFDKGLQLYREHRYDEALAAFRSAHDSGVERPKSAYYVALCYHQMGQMRNAHDAYKFVCTRYANSAVSTRAFNMMREIGPTLSVDGSESGKQVGMPADLPDNLLRASSEVPSAALPSRTAGVVAGPGETILHFTDEAMDGRMYVDGTIDGHKVKMLFDTGSSVMFCRQSFLNKQKIDFPWLTQKGASAGASGEAETKIAVVKVALGPIVRTDKIYVEQDPPEALYPMYDNCPIVGQSFFQDFIVEIDGPNKTIKLKKAPFMARARKTKYVPQAREVPFEWENDHIVLKTIVNGRECKMYHDTGASQVVFADRQLPTFGLNRPVDAFNSVRKGVKGTRESYVFNIGTIKCGPILQYEVEANVLLNSKISKPLLGQTFLAPLKYTIDPTCNVIRFH